MRPELLHDRLVQLFGYRICYLAASMTNLPKATRSVHISRKSDTLRNQLSPGIRNAGHSKSIQALLKGGAFDRFVLSLSKASFNSVP
eukprot:2561985-Amphidinium_carterae.1